MNENILWRTRLDGNKSVSEYCDIIINNKTTLRNSYSHKQYIIIFVKADPIFLQKFIDMHKTIDKPYILITGDADRTIPRQTDKRMAKYSKDFTDEITNLANNPKLIKWYVENLDMHFSEKVIPIPLGFAERTNQELLTAREKWKTLKRYQPRSLKIMATFRVRNGIQWNERKNVMNMLARNENFITKSILEEKWLDTLSVCSHVLCVNGGGIDLCPRIFEALWMGCIPIALKTDSMQKCFEEFPVIWIDRFEDVLMENIINYELCHEINDLSAEKFRMIYWWNKMNSNML